MGTTSIGLVYKITNLLNNKSYIGQTTQLKRRLSEHFKWKEKKSYIARAIAKHGKDNFEVEILSCAINLESLDELEIQLIREHNTLVPNGYNLDKGGQARRVFSEQTRQKMSNACKGRVPWNKGKKSSAETIKRLSDSHKGLPSTFKGRKHTEETKKYISELQRGKERPSTQIAVEATHILTNEKLYYKKIVDADKDGFQHSNIIKVLKGQRKTHKNYIWRYA